MTDILLRADASAQMGTGHIMRCLALAQAWQATGAGAHVALAGAAPALEARLVSEGIKVHPIMAAPGLDDAAQTLELARQLGAAWIVVDGYHFDTSYQQAIKQAGRRLLFIDDYGHAGHYHADLVLNQNIYADESFYTRREPHTRLLLGTRYALLRREFWPWRGRPRAIPPVARKVLVTLGGADPDNATLRAIQALQQIGIENVQARVIIGGSNPHAETLRSALRGLSSQIRLEHSVADMPALMAWADLAISAGGTTCWELAFMGLPALVLILADNQQPVAEGLEAAGAAINLGRPAALAPADLARALAELASAPEKRADLSRRGQALVDGVGAARVVQQMQAYGLTLRPARADDCRPVWEWANEPATRAASFSSEPIPWEDHVRWFTTRLADPNTLFYIALNAEAAPLGSVRYQVDGREAIISISLAPDQRGRGYGSHIIRLASRQVFENTAVNVIHAYVKPENIASARAFVKAGFSDGGAARVREQPALHFVLRKEARS